jgi:hypothetical protein
MYEVRITMYDLKKVKNASEMERFFIVLIFSLEHCVRRGGFVWH